MPLKGDMQRFFHKIDEKVVSSCLLQYKPVCVINSDKLLVLLRFQNISCRSVSVGFAEKNLGFRFGLGFHDKRDVNFFTTRVIWRDFHHH